MASQMRVQLVGTGGATNEARHQACLLVDWGDRAAGGRILLDAGGGLDLVRQLMTAECEPTEIRHVFVSHQHADHLGGLEPFLLWSIIKILGDRGSPPAEGTSVYAAPQTLADIESLFRAVASPVPRLFGGTLRLVPLSDGLPIDLPGGARLRAFSADHEPRGRGALGCQIEVQGRRLIYSGDTRPTRALTDAARDADVLVHEAGGLDARASEVHRLGHSTGGDAGRAAERAGVGRLILTHVPCEGSAEPMLAEARAAFGGPVELGFDRGLVEIE